MRVSTMRRQAAEMQGAVRFFRRCIFKYFEDKNRSATQQFCGLASDGGTFHE